jgi:hypothetical protein
MIDTFAPKYTCAFPVIKDVSLIVNVPVWLKYCLPDVVSLHPPVDILTVPLDMTEATDSGAVMVHAFPVPTDKLSPG